MTSSDAASGLPRRLRGEWWLWVALEGIGLGALGSVIASGQAARWAAWLPASALVAGYGLAFSGARLTLNRRPAEIEVLSTLGAGTTLTMLRGWLISVLAGLLFLPPLAGGRGWIPALCYTAADLADQFDGYLARRTRHSTLLGQALDLELDGLGLLLAVALAIHYDQLPIAFLAVGLARYGFVLWNAALRTLGRAPKDIPDSSARRAIAGLQMGFMSTALWPITPPAVALLAGSILAVPFFLSFGRDAAVVAGWIDVASSRYQAIRRGLLQAATRGLPPFLRAGLLFAAGPVAWRWLVDFPRWTNTLAAAEVPHAAAVAAVAAVAQALALVAVAVGFLGRTAALALVAVYGLTMAALGVTPSGLVAFGFAVMLLLLGTGPASLWSPEGEWLGKRRGARA
jgi:CDP-diacylglycerol--glycerol-3-phosphate 3-phosphatidyltransferase